jgi:subtilisin-like proprotein convertase family protein
MVSAGLLAGLAGVALAPAQSQRPDNRRHLLLVPATPEATAALARTDARVVARYESFSLVEAAGRDDERLRRAGAERRDDMTEVETAAGSIDPTAERALLAAKEGPDRTEVLALVQFVGPPKEAWVERLARTGVRIVTYQAANAYVVHARGRAVSRLAALQGGDPAVRAVSVMTAADKLEDRSSPAGTFAVSTVAGTAGADARDRAARSGRAVDRAATVGALRTEYRTLSTAEAQTLAADPAVVAVEAYAEPELLDERAAQIVAGNLTAGFAPIDATYLDWLVDPARIPDDTTFGFAIDVTDEGLDDAANPPAHSDFRTLGAGASRVAYQTDYTAPPPSPTPDLDTDSRDCGGHGTNVASIATGYNAGTGGNLEDSAGFNHGLGVAPFARLGASKIFRGCSGDRAFSLNTTVTTLTSNAHAGGARISNNSWGTGTLATWGDYSARAREYDQLVRDAQPGSAGDQQMVEVFSAGNDGDDNPGFPDEGYGTISAEGSAKNVITVGASEGVRASGMDGCGVPNGGANSARDIIDFSSRGPTDDGRIKPDLVAPGTHITGAAPLHGGYNGDGTCNQFFSGTTRYSLVSGTSQAAPQVSGAAALVRRWYSGTEGTDPSPAMTKALLVNTATDLGGGLNGKGDTIAPGPNTDQGWGRVNLGTVFDSTAREYRDQRPADFLTESGASHVRSYSVPDASRPVKVTLAWTDAPGPTTGNPVVNNLDLVVDAGGRTYKGNVFADTFSRTGGSADPRNNVESVYLPAGTASRIAVTVRGTAVVGDGLPGQGDTTDQDFALVVSNANEQAAGPVLSGEPPAVSDAGPGGDEDGALEPGEAFGLDQEIRNAGDGSATGVSGTMSAAAPVSFSQPASPYPDTAAGGVSANDDRFAGAVEAGATCGADLSATLSVATDQGTHDIPVVLPTGFPGSPSPQSRTHSPVLSIPDDSAAGASSSLNIATPGVIKDLDVSIARITHGWVGDLTIQLTGPDGTTVRLAEHPGGPDNGGKNFVDTVFDDEASVNISSGTAPYTGSFRPQNDDLSRFDGKNKQGTWTLRVRDLFEGDTGTLTGWGTNTRSAVCARNPQTTITEHPQGQFVESTSATFEFTATELPGSPPFECRLDAQPFVACGATGTQSYSDLADGQHTFEVRAIDAQGDADPSPATHTWFVDTVGPAVDIDQPLNQSVVVDPTPTLTGTAGTADGDISTVGVRIHAGTDTTTPPVQQPNATVSAGGWSATATHLADGVYTVVAEQADLAGHSTTATATFTLQADTVDPVVSIATPAEGSGTTDATPQIAGTAGVDPGDENTVTVEIFSGPTPTGSPLRTLPGVPRDGAGSWSTEAPEPLALGTYSVRASQRDSAGNVGESVVTFSVADGDPPDVTIASPADGSSTADATPVISGSAGTAAGDGPSVTVRILDAGGGAVQELAAPVSGGSWSTTAAPLAEGTYTVRAEQSDAVGNRGSSAPATFTVDIPDPPPPGPQAPSFVLAPAEERMADALAGRLTVVAACAAACQVSARVTVSPRAARSLGLGGKATALGSGSKRLTGAGNANVRVRLTKRARAALRRREAASATLRVTVTEGTTTLVLSRTISLRRSIGLRRIVSRGMRLWAVCSKSCPLSGKLSVTAATARRMGLRPRGSARTDVASGRANLPTGSPTRLTLKVRSGAKEALRKARGVRVLLEATAGAAPSPRRTASRAITLRR